jgi:hypothetical protein
MHIRGRSKLFPFCVSIISCLSLNIIHVLHDFVWSRKFRCGSWTAVLETVVRCMLPQKKQRRSLGGSEFLLSIFTLSPLICLMVLQLVRSCNHDRFIRHQNCHCRNTLEKNTVLLQNSSCWCHLKLLCRAQNGIEEMCRDQWNWASKNPFGYQPSHADGKESKPVCNGGHDLKICNGATAT